MRDGAGDMIMMHSPYRQSGLSLIELMISVVLGLLLVAGAMQIFLANTQAFRLQDNISGAQESGRLALEIVLADLRRAGVDYAKADGGATILHGIKGKNGSAATAAIPGLLNNSDEITITYRVPVEVGSLSDCEGNVIAPGGLVVNRYFVRLDTNPSIPALFCAGGAGAGTALVRGVESFQLQYGVMTPPAVLRPELKDVKANGFASPSRYVLGEAASGTNLRITSIRVGLLMRSEAGIQGLQAPASDINVLDQTVTKAVLANAKVNGSFPVHRYFSGTAAMRNEVYAQF